MEGGKSMFWALVLGGSFVQSWGFGCNLSLAIYPLFFIGLLNLYFRA